MIKDFVGKLIVFYILVLDIAKLSKNGKDRISFTEILDMNNIKYVSYSYSYDGNYEHTKVGIVYNGDIFKMYVTKYHKDNRVEWGLINDND